VHVACMLIGIVGGDFKLLQAQTNMLSCHTHWDGKGERTFGVMGVCVMCVERKATDDALGFQL